MEKNHVGEVDYLRVFALIAIVLLHAWGFFLQTPLTSTLGSIFQELSINLLRFGRMVFMFVTGLVLFYGYNGRQVKPLLFLSRRLRTLVIPYAIWTAVYLLIKYWSHMVSWSSFTGFIIVWLQNMLNGNGFYHLYYIIVAIQFYLLFTLIYGIRTSRPRLWASILLGIGFVLYVFYYYLLEIRGAAVISYFTGTSLAGFAQWLLHYKDRLLISYLPYYLLGALAGLNIESWQRWIERHFRIILIGLTAGLGLVVGEYFYFHRYLGQSWASTISVFKPSIYIYSLAVITSGAGLAFYLERQGKLRRLITPLAANSLGIFLIHPAVLFFFHSFLWNYQTVPVYLLVILDPLAALTVSWGISSLLASNRYTRLIVGEAGNLRRNKPRRTALARETNPLYPNKTLLI
ncbi:MAG: acyltransferase [Bacillota bacterium]